MISEEDIALVVSIRIYIKVIRVLGNNLNPSQWLAGVYMSLDL